LRVFQGFFGFIRVFCWCFRVFFRVLGFNEGLFRFLKGVLCWCHQADISNNFLESGSHLAESSSHVTKFSSHLAKSNRIKQVFYGFVEGFSGFFFNFQLFLKGFLRLFRFFNGKLVVFFLESSSHLVESSRYLVQI
jgi:hypothetical protein